MDTITTIKPLEGTAYGRGPQTHNATLTEVGPGTPGGEWLRRYWHPVAISSEVTARPKRVRILGEDLIVFRDKKGRPGLVYPRCMHRGTTLFYGKVEDEGIRCCYHGWLFAVDGTCLQQPCEPDGGRNRKVARQPWYPVQERYGLVFAYMGPPDRMPVLPRYDTLEDLAPGEFHHALPGNFFAYGDHVEDPVPYNWLQIFENVVDPYHVQVLHSTFSAVQFAEGFKVMPKVEFETVEAAVVYHAHRKFDDGREMDRVSAAMLPNIAAVPAIDLSPGRPRAVSWFVPLDDTHWQGFYVAVTAQAFRFPGIPLGNGKTWTQMTPEERQDFPGDFEAQSGQGPISLHSEEHLASTDRGIIMLRRLLNEQIKRVQAGGDPAGVTFDESQSLVKVLSGNFFTTGVEV
jgi:phenylpropionate dioxygenase-like ring-hydroxylating dioxygenase large terminal subunit